MQYYEYLLLFIVIPSIIGYLILRKYFISDTMNEKDVFLTLGILSIIALVYTTPWDNYLVATSVWWYDQSQILGIIIGYVPLEEYTFFVLETLLVGFFAFILIIRFKLKFPSKLKYGVTKEKLLFIGYMAVLWITSVIMAFCKITSYNYLGLILAWALPPITLQILVGWDLFNENKTKISIFIVIVGGYLSLTDFIAISLNIWTINPDKIIGLNLGVLPFEESLFFYVTVIFITLGTLLIYYYRKREQSNS